MKPKQSAPGKTPEVPEGEPHGATLDRYDIAILRELQRDARLSNTELASRIGLSAAPTWRRVKWLEEQRYITGYRAEIDRRRVGLGVLAFVRVELGLGANGDEAILRYAEPPLVAHCTRDEAAAH